MSDNQEQWNEETVSNILRRQIAEMEQRKAELLAEYKNPDDDEELLNILLETQSLRRMLDRESDGDV